MRTFKKAVLLSVSLTAVPALVLAAGDDEDKVGAGTMQGATIFSQADADQNGAVDRNEAEAVQGFELNFEIADADADGNLSQGEYETALRDALAQEQAAPSAGGSGAQGVGEAAAEAEGGASEGAENPGAEGEDAPATP